MYVEDSTGRLQVGDGILATMMYGGGFQNIFYTIPLSGPLPEPCRLPGRSTIWPAFPSPPVPTSYDLLSNLRGPLNSSINT